MEQFERELLELLPRLRRFARSLTRDATEADDLCQTAVEKALKRRRQRREDARLDAWMFMIMRNCWIDMQRSRRRQTDRLLPVEAADLAQSSAAQASDPLAAMSLHRGMKAISRGPHARQLPPL